jgi:hypothetical protein
MKISVIFLLFLCMLSASCKKKSMTVFEIKGEVLNLNGTAVELEQNGAVVDRTVVKNNSFLLKGTLWDNQICQVVFKSNKPIIKANRKVTWLASIDVFVEESADYLLTANGATEILENNYKINTTSKNQLDFDGYRSLLAQQYKDIKRHISYLGLKQDSALAIKDDELYTRYTGSIRLNEKALGQLNNKLTHRLVAQQPNSYVSVYLLSKAPDIHSNKGFYKYIQQNLLKKYLNHPYGELFAKRLERADRMDANSINLKLNAIDIQQKPFDYADFAESKLIVLDFWATW